MKKDSRNNTLDQWLVREEKEEEKEEVREKGKLNVYKDKVLGKSYITRLINEFNSKVNLPQIQDKNIYFDLEKKIINQLKPRRILIVTEKPKVAKTLASSLTFNHRPKVIKVGRLNIYQTKFKFIDIIIIPLTGHISEITTSKDYSGNWAKTDPLHIIEDHNALIKREKIRDITRILKEEGQKADLLILATDADEEGANIGLEAYEIIKKVNPTIPVYQMWFLSLDPRELRSAFKRPIKPKWNWALAVEARRYIDAMVGFSSTRELTLYLKKSFGSIGDRVASIGRVQTPTLYLIYLREKEIREFKPEPYWVIYAITSLDGESIKFTHIRSPFRNKMEAEKIFGVVDGAKEGRVIDIQVEKKTMLPPPPLNTTKALSDINKLFGIPSSEAMKVLEDLYLLGLITYPRTDTDKYPSDYDHEKNIKELVKIKEFTDLIQLKILGKGIRLTRNGRNLVGDHLPITPIKAPTINVLSTLSEKHKKIYFFIVRRYLALFLEPAIIEKMKILMNVREETFHTTLTSIKEEGFLEVYPYSRPQETISVRIKKGEILPIDKIVMSEEKTKPPKPISEYELIKLMERLGLGTKSTRPDHIQKLIDRGYIVRKGSSLRITKLGWSLAEHLEDIWPDFVKPFFSSKVHALMREIMNEKIDWKKAISNTRMEFKNLFLKLRESLQGKGETLVNSIKAEIESKTLIQCPVCNSPMISVKKHKNSEIIQCIKCKYKILLPKFKELVKLSPTIKCLLCGKDVYFIKRKRKIYFCPYCINKVGPCYKCSELENCEVKKLIVKDEEKRIVGKCDRCGGDVIFVPERRIVFCKECKTKPSSKLPLRGSISLLKKKHPTCNWRIFSIKIGKNRYYFCIKCGQKI